MGRWAVARPLKNVRLVWTRGPLWIGTSVLGQVLQNMRWIDPPPALRNFVTTRTRVTTILVMSATLPLAQVKSKFSEMIDRVEHTHDRIVVTRNGRPAAVMISPDDLASLEDTLEMLSDPEAMRELTEAKRAADTGDFITGDELRARFASK